jgi:hypothetical protein
VTVPGFTTTDVFGLAPFPSTRRRPLLSSARVTLIAAWAVAVTSPNATIEAATSTNRFNVIPSPMSSLTGGHAASTSIYARPRRMDFATRRRVPC